MNKLGMHRVSQSAKRSKSRGIALADVLLALVVVAVVTGIGASVYASMRSGINADDQANKTIALAADIQKNWRAAGTYVAVTPLALGNLTMVQKPMKFDTPNITDAWGNTMSIIGGASSFAITIGGTVSPLSSADCVSVATRLGDGVAQNINVGPSASTLATGGVATGGSAFKTASVINQANLVTGCQALNPTIVAQFR